MAPGITEQLSVLPVDRNGRDHAGQCIPLRPCTMRVTLTPSPPGSARCANAFFGSAYHVDARVDVQGGAHGQ